MAPSVSAMKACSQRRRNSPPVDVVELNLYPAAEGRRSDSEVNDDIDYGAIEAGHVLGLPWWNLGEVNASDDASGKTERIAWRIVNACPRVAINDSTRYHSRNTPRSSPFWRGVISYASAMSSSRTSISLNHQSGQALPSNKLVTEPSWKTSLIARAISGAIDEW